MGQSRPFVKRPEHVPKAVAPLAFLWVGLGRVFYLFLFILSATFILYFLPDFSISTQDMLSPEEMKCIQEMNEMGLPLQIQVRPHDL